MNPPSSRSRRDYGVTGKDKGDEFNSFFLSCLSPLSQLYIFDGRILFNLPQRTQRTQRIKKSCMGERFIVNGLLLID